MSQTLEIASKFRSILVASGLTDLEAVFGYSAGQRLDKPGLEAWRERWRLVIPDAQGGRIVLYLKRFRSPPLRRQFERWRMGHPCRGTAGVEWHNALELAQAGIAAAEPVAFGQRMRGLLEERSFVLLNEVPGESLERWLPSIANRRWREADYRRSLIDHLARFVGNFHQAGFVHRDLYLSHLFIEEHEDAGSVVFRLIDLQRVFRPAWRERRWAVKDLAALGYSAPADLVNARERLRFLCRYVRACPRFGSSRTLVRLIGRKVEGMKRRDATRRRDRESAGRP